MTPAQYRQKWNLPSIYPMVAPNYTAQRSAMAKNMGLGQSRKKPVAAVAASAAIEVVAPDSVSVETIKLATVEPEPEPASVTTKVVAAPPPVSAKRKLGRPRKVTA